MAAAEPPVFNLESLSKLLSNVQGSVRKGPLIRALVASGLDEQTAASHANEFFAHFDQCRQDKLPLRLFIEEYQRMVLYQALFNLKRSGAQEFSQGRVLEALTDGMGHGAANTLSKLFPVSTEH